MGLHDLVSKVMGGKGFITGCSKGLQAVFYSRKGRVGNDNGKETGFEAHHEEEWQLASDRVGAVVVCKFHMGDHFEL